MEIRPTAAYLESVRLDPALRLPSTIRTNGLIDTGAEMTVISEASIRGMGLEPIRTTYLAGVGSEDHQVPVFAVSLVIGPPDARAPAIEMSVAGAKLSGPTCLLGRDILDRGGLIWDGRRSRFRLVLPG